MKRVNIVRNKQINPAVAASILVGIGILLLSVQWCRGQPAPTSNSPAAITASVRFNASSSNTMQAAAIRGVDWLAGHKDTMPLGFALKTFEKIHRVAACEEIRKQMAALIQEKSRGLPVKAPNVANFPPDTVNWYELRPAVMDLIYLKSLNRPWKDEATKLVQLYAQRGDGILPARVNLSERLVAAYKLEILGVPTTEVYSNTLAAIRNQGAAVRAAHSQPDKAMLYAKTHVIFTASGYYARYLDPRDFEPEIKCFSESLAHFSGWQQMDHSWADIASEVVIACKLLRQPPTPHSTAMQQRLLTMQSPDGSWGGPHFNNSKIHNTVMAVLALIEFAEEFEICVDYL